MRAPQPHKDLRRRCRRLRHHRPRPEDTSPPPVLTTLCPPFRRLFSAVCIKYNVAGAAARPDESAHGAPSLDAFNATYWRKWIKRALAPTGASALGSAISSVLVPAGTFSTRIGVRHRQHPPQRMSELQAYSSCTAARMGPSRLTPSCARVWPILFLRDGVRAVRSVLCILLADHLCPHEPPLKPILPPPPPCVHG